jgi:nitrite reductase/ring-hydroxylating ferredoxin subunit
VVHSPAGLRGYVNWCAHVGVHLQDDRDEIIREDGLIVCAWHWARYDPSTGAGVDGPCVGSLPPWPIAMGEDGVVRTA